MSKRLEELLEHYDALLLPPASGPAPKGLASTGDSRFCAPATFSGLPSISLPCALVDGLPIGVQLIGRSDGPLLALAKHMEGKLNFSPSLRESL